MNKIIFGIFAHRNVANTWGSQLRKLNKVWSRIIGHWKLFT